MFAPGRFLTNRGRQAERVKIDLHLQGLKLTDPQEEQSSPKFFDGSLSIIDDTLSDHMTTTNDMAMCVTLNSGWQN
jgi:hypothetical protein